MKTCKVLGCAIVMVGMALAGCGQASAPATSNAAPGGVPTPRQAPQSVPGLPTLAPTVPGQPTPLSIEDQIIADDVFPEYYIEVDGERVDGVLGGFCWPITPADGNPYIYCSDVKLPDFTPEDRRTYTLGEPIQVHVEEPYPSVLDVSLQQSPTLYTYDQGQIVPQQPTFGWTPDVDPGDYELVLYAKWFNNDADLVYYFPLTAIAADGATPTPSP